MKINIYKRKSNKDRRSPSPLHPLFVPIGYKQHCDQEGNAGIKHVKILSMLKICLGKILGF